MTAALDFIGLNAMLNILEDGKIQLDKDKESVRQYFLQHVNQNTVFFHTLEEKLEYLIQNGYYDKTSLDKYSIGFIKKLFKKTYAKKFRFKTFLGAYKYYTSYTMKNVQGDRYLERYEDRICITALHLADGNEELAISIMEEIISGRYQPATPTFLNAGKLRGGELVSCFLVRIEDNMESISRGINAALQLSKRGGGVALLLNNLREQGAPIKEMKNMSSGVVPVMKLLEDSFSYANQLGARQGAGAVYLNAHHPDILRFLDTKRENADEKVRIKTLSLGVVVPDITFELARNNEPMYLFSPYDVEREYGKAFSDISVTELYREMVENPRITKTKISARDLFKTIAEIQFESGYPYLMFEDTVNRANNAGGRVNMTNLCLKGDTEIFVRDKTDYRETVTIEKFVENFKKNPKAEYEIYSHGLENEWNKVKAAAKTDEVTETRSIKTENSLHVESTNDHEIFTSNRGYVRAADVVKGDVLQLSNSTTVVSGNRKVTHSKAIPVYDVTVENVQNFFANGILVHNCVEILQRNTPSVLNTDLGYSVVGQDISCNLGSINIALAMESPDFGRMIETSIRALTNVSVMSKIDSVPSIVNGNEKSRAIGLGQMNLHGFYGKERLHYGSQEAIEFVDLYFMTTAFWAVKASNKIAIETGKKFHGFEDSKYASGEYFDKYVNEVYEAKSEQVAKILKKYNFTLPTTQDWEELKTSVMEHGIYNAYLQAIPPTGSISYINNSTSSIHPIVSKIEVRKEGKVGRVYYPAPFMTNDNLEFYKDAYEIGPYALIDTYAAATKHVDQGLSMTVFLPAEASTRDINKVQIYAHKKGIKTMYYIRLRQTAISGTEQAECVSCVL